MYICRCADVPCVRVLFTLLDGVDEREKENMDYIRVCMCIYTYYVHILCVRVNVCKYAFRFPSMGRAVSNHSLY